MHTDSDTLHPAGGETETRGAPGHHPAEEQIQTILEAAAGVFAAQGFAGARVEAIAKAAGINKAMLYYRVGDKARLYELAVLRQFDRVAGIVETACAGPGSSADRLGQVLKALAGLFTANPRLPRIMAWELASGGRTMPSAVTAVLGRILSAVAPLAIRAKMDPACTWFSMVGSTVFMFLTEPLRARLLPALPEPMAVMGRATVEDMADFLAGLFRLASQDAQDSPHEDTP